MIICLTFFNKSNNGYIIKSILIFCPNLCSSKVDAAHYANIPFVILLITKNANHLNGSSDKSCLEKM